jgi:membrane-bound lytic murein transglycosylase D
LRFDPLLLQLSGPEFDAMNAPVIALNKQAVRFVDNYIAQNNELLQSIGSKYPRYFKIMDEVFMKYNLPVQLKYLAVVESELNINAVSRVGAAGPWQLMPATARILSLKVTAGYDERKHFYKSTVAAAKYLRDLYEIFDDWTLAIAAYNAGPAPVLKAIKKSGSRNFWALQYYLPAETRGHVKKFIGTHYYFEGHGSITTVTKQERLAYTQAMLTYVEKQNKLISEKQGSAGNDDNSNDLPMETLPLVCRSGEIQVNE